jgi:flagellar hook assembly protein FlgD
LVSVADDVLPQKIELEQNYPNPFNPKTDISFIISLPDRVVLSIYNIMGQEVATIMNSDIKPGKHTVSWSGKDSMGKEVSSGMYFYKLTVGDISYQKKLILLR